jgi:thiamine biosynthesis protein ThiS
MKDSIMEITANGKKRHFTSARTVAELLRTLGFGSHLVVVERNLEIVPRDAMDRVSLRKGDTLEIVRLIGGG